MDMTHTSITTARTSFDMIAKCGMMVVGINACNIHHSLCVLCVSLSVSKCVSLRVVSLQDDYRKLSEIQEI